MLEDCLELLCDLLSYFVIKVLTHYCYFLSPTNRKLIRSEVLYDLAQYIGAVEPGHQRLSFITELHSSLDGFFELNRLKNAH